MPYVFKNNQDQGDLETGTRICESCSERQPMTNFHWANGKKNRRRKCKNCNRLRALDVRAESPVKYKLADRRRHFKRMYNITLEDYEAMLTAQDNKCAICCEVFSHKKDKLPHVDHCHQSGKVRAILCFTCNTALGKFRDSEKLLLSAVDYLRKYA
jgi:hypothetical protein